MVNLDDNGIGRHQARGSRRRTGKKTVINRFCPSCGNDRAFCQDGPLGHWRYKCTRCGLRE